MQYAGDSLCDIPSEENLRDPGKGCCRSQKVPICEVGTTCPGLLWTWDKGSPLCEDAKWTPPCFFSPPASEFPDFSSAPRCSCSWPSRSLSDPLQNASEEQFPWKQTASTVAPPRRQPTCERTGPSPRSDGRCTRKGLIWKPPATKERENTI